MQAIFLASIEEDTMTLIMPLSVDGKARAAPGQVAESFGLHSLELTVPLLGAK